MFAIISAGRPYPPQDCGYTNKTSFIQINCKPGFDGGIRQSFVLQVWYGSLAGRGWGVLVPYSFIQSK